MITLQGPDVQMMDIHRKFVSAALQTNFVYLKSFCLLLFTDITRPYELTYIMFFGKAI